MAEAPGTHDPTFLPPDIPAPRDDGRARHLTGARLPDVALPATGGGMVNLSKLKGRTVVYVYPRTGVPGVDLPQGWNEIPGARGCTSQSAIASFDWAGVCRPERFRTSTFMILSPSAEHTSEAGCPP